MFGQNDGTPKNLDVLMNIENVVLNAFREDRSMLDKDVMKAYDALETFYRYKVKGKSANPPKLEYLSLELYNNIQEVLEVVGALNDEVNPQTTRRRFSRVAFKKEETYDEKILAAVRRLQKSLKLWNGEKGATGYLDFIDAQLKY